MAKSRRPQSTIGLATLVALVRSLLASLANVWDTLWEAFLEWQQERKRSSSGAPAKRRRRQKAVPATAPAAAPAAQAASKPAVKPTLGPSSQVAGGNSATLPTRVAGSTSLPSTSRPAAKPVGKPPPATAFDSSSSSEDEGEVPAASTLPPSWASLAGAMPPSGAGAWEPVRSKKPARSAAGSAVSGAGTRAGAAPPLHQQQRKRGTLRTCDRPGCGAEGRGFRKCGSCGTVFYCTPACQGSDWERHEPQCV